MFSKGSLRHHQPAAYRRRPPTRPAVEQLEARAVPAPFTVTNLNDAGAGSLRQAILDANANNEADAIVFQPGLTGSIPLTSGELAVKDSVTITGPGAGVITLDGKNAGRIFKVDNGAAGAINVAISGLTLTRGNAGSGLGGGAIDVADEALALSGVVLTDNTANFGGGLSLGAGGLLTLDHCTVSGNRADGLGSPLGGGLYLGTGSVTLVRNSTISGNQAIGGPGGGAFVDSDGSLTVENSTVSGNSAGMVGGGIDVQAATLVVRNSTVSGNSAAFGGGILMQGPALSSSSLTVETSTVSGNSARGDGGGIFMNRTTAVIRNSTVAFNTADSDNVGGGSGGGLFSGPASDTALTLKSTIVGRNAVGATGSDPDVSGTLVATNSLIENTTGTLLLEGVGDDIFGKDPLLGPLQFNGGPTRTHALLPGSPAIDHGANPAGLAFDQRGAGFARAAGAGVDIGAFELQPNPPPPAPASSPQIVAVAFRRKGVSRVRVTDAATGAVRRVLTPFKGFGGRLRLQLVDVNGDGALDLIVRALINGKRKKKVFDALTLAPLPPGPA